MPEDHASALRIEVAYALPERQYLVRLVVPAGTTAEGAVELSGLAARVAGLTLDGAAFAVFGRTALPGQVLRDGDRVELLRPLQADPKEVRRALAAQGRTMGKTTGKARDRSAR